MQHVNIHVLLNHKADILKFMLAGIVIAGTCILGVYVFDNTIKTEQDIESTFQTLVLGTIPYYKPSLKRGGKV